ncbi:MAG: PQQ-dependent sugar dehydrogenase [bacterium]|nr:PQQ-dependent sugar dehydrogenase [bacterium]
MSRIPLGLAALLCGAWISVASAQTTGNPIPTSAPIASWTIELADVVTIPDSAGLPPRLEDLVWNETTGLAYVIDQRGTIHSFPLPSASPVASVFLDLDAAVGDLFIANEAGVRAMAFHPDFGDPTAPGFRKLYVTFSRTAQALPVGGPVDFASPSGVDHRTVLAEWTLLPSGEVDPASYRELMRIAQPFVNHDGGDLGFDPRRSPGDADYGLLYLALGDGGSFGDPFGLAQDIDTTPTAYPHGKILRIDPLQAGTAPYSVPASNPFFGQPDRIEEIWAYGFRNPHKFFWDRVSGRLLVSDIGQGVVEEIDLVRRGQNHGWDGREGAYTYVNGSSVSPLPPEHPNDDFAYPVAQYDHVQNGLTGNAAIVAGPVYRGASIPALTGTMFFADFATSPGPIFAVHVNQLLERNAFGAIGALEDGRLAPYQEVRIRDGGVDKTFRDFLRDATGNPFLSRTDTRFAEGDDGEIYVLNKQDGVVRRISAAPGHPGPSFFVPVLGGVGPALLLGGAVTLGAFAVRGRRPTPGGND